MFRYRYGILSAVLALLLAVACAPSSTPAQLPAPEPKATPALTAPPSPSLSPEEAAWQKTVEAAKKEREVNIYSFNFTGDRGLAIAKAFENRYGIKLNIITGRGAEFVERLKTEKRMGQMVADATEGAVPNLLNAKGTGVTISVPDLPVLQEKGVWIVEPKANDAEGHILAASQIVYSPWINTRLLKPEQAPKSYYDLLKPEWTGKIISHDPVLSSAPYNWLVTLVNAKILDWEYVRAFGQQKLRLEAGGVQAAQVLSRGELPLIMMNTDTNGASFVKEGAPIKAISMQEGNVAQVLGMAVIKDSPHPNTAKVLANWLLTEEGQSVWGRAQSIAMVRKGVPDFRPADAQAPPTRLVVTTSQDLEDQARLIRESFIANLWKK